MTYQLREDTYDDDQLDELSDAELELLRADVKAEWTAMNADVKVKQWEYKSGLGPGLPGHEHYAVEKDIALLRKFEAELEYLQVKRRPKIKKIT